MMKREAEKTDEIGHFFLLVLFCKVKTFRAIRSTNLTRQVSTFLNVKNADIIIKLKKYIDRKSASISCYAMRRFLNLRISSNAVEKANDTMVAKRQKHNKCHL